MMISSYLVQELSGDRLLIAAQPDYLFAALFAVPAMTMAVVFLYRAFRARSFYPLIGILIFCCPFLFAGTFGLKAGSLTLDRNHNIAIFHATTFFGYDNFTIPLDQIHYAEVRGGGQADYILVVLNNGDEVSFTDANQDSGKGRAAHAINQYIGYNGQ
jgi:hypothetical protein